MSISQNVGLPLLHIMFDFNTIMAWVYIYIYIIIIHIEIASDMHI